MGRPDKETMLRRAAAELGRRGGLVGGPARAKAMTPERRSEIARAGAAATNLKRWGAKVQTDELRGTTPTSTHAS